MTPSPAQSALWLRRFTPAPPGAARLVCFPYAGGSASFYLPVSRALSAVADVVAVQYPGRQDRRNESSLDTVDALAEAVYAVLVGEIGRPLVFFGHSMGAIIAFEVARRLEQRDGVTLSRLVASGRRAPSRYREETVHLGDDDRIIAELKLLSGTDAAVLGDEEILRMVLPALRADYRAIETYRHPEGVRLACPITVLTGDQDPRVSIDEARAWDEHTTAECETRVLSGGHFFLTHHHQAINALLGESVRDHRTATR